ncbi:MAG: hypothetical protein ACYCW6_06885 [Candidatus Xenobia bacterium]
MYRGPSSAHLKPHLEAATGILHHHLSCVLAQDGKDRVVRRLQRASLRLRRQAGHLGRRPVRTKTGSYRLAIVAVQSGLRCAILDGLAAHFAGGWDANRAWATVVGELAGNSLKGIMDINKIQDLSDHAARVVENMRPLPGPVPPGRVSNLVLEGYQIGMELLRRNLTAGVQQAA